MVNDTIKKGEVCTREFNNQQLELVDE